MRGATLYLHRSALHLIISIHAPHAGSDYNATCSRRPKMTISIHAPHAGSDSQHLIKGFAFSISIHAPHAGSDVDASPVSESKPEISIHAPHAGSDKDDGSIGYHRGISIHAPHAGSDFKRRFKLDCDTSNFYPRSPCGERRKSPRSLQPAILISIHAPHAGSDRSRNHGRARTHVFLSTLPMRGATF